MNIVPSDLTLRRAQLLGLQGQQWLECLDEVVRTTLDKFGLTFIKTLHGGSESYLALTQRTDGARCVVKVMMPNDHGMTAELAALQAAKGRGYVELIDANPEQDVLIIEELGAPIASSALTTQQQLQHITHALQLSWQAEIEPSALVHGAKKADWLYHHIQHTPTRVTGYVEKVLIHTALDHIDLRRSLWREDAFVLVHGDAHEHNTLAIRKAKGQTEPQPALQTEPTGYKLVDPDGLFFEAAYDLGILLRNWIDAYRIAQPATTLTERATWLAQQTQVSPQAMVSWGFVEIVSTGIHLLELGYPDEGKDYLDLGQALLPVL